MKATPALETLAPGLSFRLKSRRSGKPQVFQSSFFSGRQIHSGAALRGGIVDELRGVENSAEAATAFAAGNSPFYVGSGCACLTAITENGS